MTEPKHDAEDRVRRVAERLRYRALDELVGREVLVRSTASAAEDVRQGLQPDAEAWEYVGPETWRLEGVLATYGFLDLEFRAPASLLERGYESGVALLEGLGFVERPREAQKPNRKSPAAGGEDPTCLEKLEEDLVKGLTVVRIYLDTDVPIKKGFFIKPSPGYLPRTFTVEDACATNAGSVWFHKYFYL